MDDGGGRTPGVATRNERSLSPRPSKRIKRKLSSPSRSLRTHVNLVSNPLHNPYKPVYGSLDAFLDSFVLLEDDIQLTPKQAEEQITRVVALEKSVTSSSTIAAAVQSINVNKKLKKAPEPKTAAKHNTYLNSHAINFANLMVAERRSNIVKAKKLSSLVVAHFKKKALQVEREKKEEEKRLVALAKRLANDVKKKWRLADKEVRRRWTIRIEEYKADLDKKNLQKMLERSSELLERSNADVSSEQATEKDILDESESDISQMDSEMEDEEDDEEESEEEESQDEGPNWAALLGYAVPKIEDEEPDEEEIVKTEEGSTLEQENKSDNEISKEVDELTEIVMKDRYTESNGEQKANIGPQLNKIVNVNMRDLHDGEEADKSMTEPNANDDCVAMKGVVDDERQINDSISASEIKLNSDFDERRRAQDDVIDKEIPIPFLLRGTLREYQYNGLRWLAGLYEKQTNGILADEMGLGKTIQTISLLSWLACEKEIWAPHLVVVPTSVMLNWEMEFKKFAPGFKIMVYYGSPAQRKEKRKGWYKQDTFHVCITSYQLVIQDQQAFKRRRWEYLILDEAHNIKNFRSQRWLTLLNFNTNRRLLLTGTPLQNSLAELWSLLYFLMPSESSKDGGEFADLKVFQSWFSKPIEKLIDNGQMNDQEAKAAVGQLHQVLRPYLLRRLKADVEKQMPGKYEHIIKCKLSKRQRILYDDFMSRAKTRETLASGNFLSIINCLMQLRKVCNHPDLFEVRPIRTSLVLATSVAADYEIKDFLIRRNLLKDMIIKTHFLQHAIDALVDLRLSAGDYKDIRRLDANQVIAVHSYQIAHTLNNNLHPDLLTLKGHRDYLTNSLSKYKFGKFSHWRRLNEWRCSAKPRFGWSILKLFNKPSLHGFDSRSIYDVSNVEALFRNTDIVRSCILSLSDRYALYEPAFSPFTFVTPSIIIRSIPKLIFSSLTPVVSQFKHYPDVFHDQRTRLTIAFPDKRLLQYDCGKLQRLDQLLRELQSGGHRALIFTQMTKVLDILEQFLNIHGHKYLRLDGATKVEQRQVLTERFNKDNRILCFISSTRSGGLGINLTGADSVIFYDSDWNPSMDRQCQDRCHRIGQTRDVHIYRLVSEYTIEENVLRKANQKRMLDNVVIGEGDFTTSYFEKMDWKDMFGGVDVKAPAPSQMLTGKSMEKALALVEDEEDVVAARAAQKEIDDIQTEDKKDIGDEEGTGSTPVNGTNAASGSTSVNNVQNGVKEEIDAEAQLANEEPEPGHIDDYMVNFIERFGYMDTW